jgi:coproporphyrinogen III oxidase-like Fe-S oxidoreductase
VEKVWDIPGDELGFEFMMNTLRLTGGFELGLFQQRTGRPWKDIEPALNSALARGLIEVNGEKVKPTLLGQRFLNELLQLFLE